MGSKLGSAPKSLMEDKKMWYEYVGCNARRGERRGSIGDELEVEDYGGDGHD